MPGIARRWVAATAAAALAVLAATGPASAATSHAEITGSGSSWAANAVNQWVSDVSRNGLQVVYTSTGSASGRQSFALKSVDFAFSDIPYQGRDPISGLPDTSDGRPYAYLPVVAGGTSFPYHIGNGASQIKNLRLSGRTLALIFTNKITNWDDPQIAADNNGMRLPNLAIIPVVHSEGSGDTAQFTQYLEAEYPSIWNPYNGVASFTEYWPRTGAQVAQNGSDGVMNFISSRAGNGTIGFDEYSYALLANFPVAKILNAAGYYTAPTQYNVAVALQDAQINEDPLSIDYLTQNLTNVYTNPDIQTYPISSYSYAIIPTGNNAVETHTDTTAKRQTIADFLYDSICQGQGEIGPIGYSALPINLVQAGFAQIAKLHAADHGVDLNSENVSTCNNPTFIPGKPNVNHLAVIAPVPPPCDKKGAGPCAPGVGVQNSNPVNGRAPAATSSNGSTTTGTGQGTSGTSGTGGGTGSAGTTGGAGTGGTTGGTGTGVATSIDPNTGQQVADGGTGGGTTTTVNGTATNLADAAQSSGLSWLLAILAVALLLAALVVPVLAGRYFAARRP
ncbi:MAG TPA: substrate-binding domain-containing protein [Jatrophihabitantaceae bacterium]|jgi:phosphate transport system substrate-binding protein|nr:substrate-binding domain-containing protein [Jatrophihabitantaceae bacterium]